MNGQPSSHPRRGIYLLPNLFTTGALFCGFYACTAAINGRHELAAIVIFVAMVLDGLDGRVARLTNTQSDFGAEYDSMADMMSFGVAPALLMYTWVLASLGKLGWFAAFVHAAGGALRLARFNAQLETADHHYFQGLPSPSAAAILAGFAWVALEYRFDSDLLRYIALVLTISTGLLMVSNVRYYSFKDIDLRGKVPFVVVIVLTLVFGVIFAHPPVMLFLIFSVYALSGPVMTLFFIYKRRRNGRG